MSSLALLNCVKQVTYNNECVNIIPAETSGYQHIEELVDLRTNNGFDDAFFVCNISKLLLQHELWVQHLPCVQPFYAVTCNDDSVLLATLAHLGCNFACASKTEVDKVRSLNVQPHRILYTNPCKPASFITHASECGVDLFTFDQEEELYKIKELYPSARLLLRLSFFVETATSRVDSKFGCEPGAEAEELLEHAAALHLSVVGLAFHLGSNCRNPRRTFAAAIARARRLFDFGNSLGFDFTILDIGGGFPGVDTPEMTFPQVVTMVNGHLEKHFPASSGVHIIAEPGRFYAAKAFDECVQVIGKRKVPASKITKNDADTSEPGFMYIVNDGINGSFATLKFGHMNPVPVPLRENVNDDDTWCIIYGPTRHSNDKILDRYRIADTDVGDWLIFPEHGAYSMMAASEFNRFQKAEIHYFMDEKAWAKLEALSISKEATKNSCSDVKNNAQSRNLPLYKCVHSYICHFLRWIAMKLKR